MWWNRGIKENVVLNKELTSGASFIQLPPNVNVSCKKEG